MLERETQMKLVEGIKWGEQECMHLSHAVSKPLNLADISHGLRFVLLIKKYITIYSSLKLEGRGILIFGVR